MNNTGGCPVTARKHTSGLLTLGDPGDPALPSRSDLAAEPAVVPQFLNVARLMESLPSLVGDDPERVAMATLLRERCVCEVMCLLWLCWDRATPDSRSSGETEALLRAKWLEWVQALRVPTDATWWLVHGRNGHGGVLHPALDLARKLPGAL